MLINVKFIVQIAFSCAETRIEGEDDDLRRRVGAIYCKWTAGVTGEGIFGLHAGACVRHGGIDSFPDLIKYK